MSTLLEYNHYRIHLELGGYDYTIRRELPPIIPTPEITPTVMGTTHAVWLEDEKNCWYIGQCDTAEQALQMVGLDMVRHAAQMDEMSQYDEEPKG